MTSKLMYRVDNNTIAVRKGNSGVGMIARNGGKVWFTSPASSKIYTPSDLVGILRQMNVTGITLASDLEQKVDESTAQVKVLAAARALRLGNKQVPFRASLKRVRRKKAA